MKTRLLNLTRTLYLLLAVIALAAPAHAQSARHVDWIEANGELSRPMLSYITRAISIAEKDGATALVVQLNTPGGETGLMQDIVEAIRASQVPVIIYVAPQGAWAGSAGTLITLAGHAAAMSPGTAIGAASPVGAGPQGIQELAPTEKAKLVQAMQALARSLASRRSPKAIQLAMDTIENARAVSAQEALDAGLVDAIATDRADLLQKLDGFEVEIGGHTQKLELSGAEIRPVSQSIGESLLNILTNPNIAFLLLAVGAQALLIELSNPGMWIPGFVGVVCLALFVYSIGVIPVNLLGLVFIITAFVLFILDIKTPTHGALTVAGIATFIGGALVMFNGPLQPGQIRVQPISIPLVVAVGLANGAFFAFILSMALRAQQVPLAMGAGTLLGKVGEARTDLCPTGTVFVSSELWSAEADGAPISNGSPVVVTRVDGLKLWVKRQHG